MIDTPKNRAVVAEYEDEYTQKPPKFRHRQTGKTVVVTREKEGLVEFAGMGAVRYLGRGEFDRRYEPVEIEDQP